MTPRETPSLSRRGALGGLTAAGLGLPVLAACSGGGGSDDVAADPATGSPTPSSSPTASASAEPAPTEGNATAAPADGLVPLADVEVGGGVILPDEAVVVTQPVAGEVRAFSTTCTHQGCPVTEVTDGAIVCPCHRSLFSIDTGEPVSGPATSPLDPVAVTLRGGTVQRA
ncbi:Rieske (2Fe-2S) protein [Nocardioides nanhaiensis]|uniref:Cytochrome bc1 complex Rieske iron-sulfur subunit n=1 Tax=Nocardioides nanhaiensis TaxID=1476871 RepID=A0ABP8WMR1_9ACTN